MKAGQRQRHHRHRQRRWVRSCLQQFLAQGTKNIMHLLSPPAAGRRPRERGAPSRSAPAGSLPRNRIMATLAACGRQADLTLGACPWPFEAAPASAQGARRARLRKGQQGGLLARLALDEQPGRGVVAQSSSRPASATSARRGRGIPTVSQMRSRRRVCGSTSAPWRCAQAAISSNTSRRPAGSRALAGSSSRAPAAGSEGLGPAQALAHPRGKSRRCAGGPPR